MSTHGFLPRGPRELALCLVPALFAVACVASDGSTTEHLTLGADEGALHGFGANPTPDTTWTSAGMVNGCSGTLIASDMVLTAAHCVSQVAQGCISPETWISAGTQTFTVSRTGRFANAVDAV